MEMTGQSALVTGGASGLGLATVVALLEHGAFVTIADLPSSAGEAIATELGERATFVPTDVTVHDQVINAVSRAAAIAPLRAVVHTAGRGGPVRLVDRSGEAGDSNKFAEIVNLNLVGTFTVASIGAASMASNEPVSGERGVIVTTASVAAFEGQIGQAAYAASKAGVVGLTLVAARDLATKLVRVCTIAPGTMDTPMLSRLSDEVRASLATAVPNPSRLGLPEEFADLALAIIGNRYLNGETIRLDGAIRMPPR